MKTPDFDTDLPALVPEIVADTITQSPERARRLCERARRHWLTNEGFRKSFARKDERDVLAMWMHHWHDGDRTRARRCLDDISHLKD